VKQKGSKSNIVILMDGGLTFKFMWKMKIYIIYLPENES
jgi:hypothetical protein